VEHSKSKTPQLFRVEVLRFNILLSQVAEGVMEVDATGIGAAAVAAGRCSPATSLWLPRDNTL
jgi:hypothetical protein